MKENVKLEKSETIAYKIGEALYLNITNRCQNKCLFCIRDTESGIGNGYDLWLEHEPTVDEVLESISNPQDYREIVFCGYGEPLSRPEVVLQVSKRLKELGAKKIRINTNGLADLFLRENIIPKLAECVDSISISLNAQNAEAYEKITKSCYGLQAYQALLDFANRSKQAFSEVVLSAVAYPGFDMKATAKVAEKLGIPFRLREYQQ